jgi:hypothetical protein
VISPLLANIYLNKLDRIWAARCSQLGILVRYAYHFVAMRGTETQAREGFRRIGLVMNRLGLTLHPAKTRLVNLSRGKEVKRIIAELTPVLRGWGNYFRTGNAGREFNRMDYYVVRSLRR